jgi:hypothetical protein
MQRTIARALTYQPYLSRSAAVLAGVCAIAIFLYGTFLLLAVMHTAGRTALEKQINATTAKLADLESVYLAKTKELTPEHALALGFVPPTSVSMVFTEGAQTLGRTNSASALSVRTQ